MRKTETKKWKKKWFRFRQGRSGFLIAVGSSSILVQGVAKGWGRCWHGPIAEIPPQIVTVWGSAEVYGRQDGVCDKASLPAVARMVVAGREVDGVKGKGHQVERRLRAAASRRVRTKRLRCGRRGLWLREATEGRGKRQYARPCPSGHDDNFRNHAWPELRQLSGYGTGHSHSVLPSLKKYLQHLGYLDTVGDIGTFPHVFDEDLQAAIKKYQLFSNLSATGILDSATVHHLIQLRCGVRDFMKGPTSAKFHRNINVIGNSIATLCKLRGARWPASRPEPHRVSDLRPFFREAFETWALSSPFDFTETSNDRIAQLHIGFYGEGHLDCPLFGDLLAHASYPPYGMLHINADYVWEIDLEILLNTEESYDVQSVTLHEIGHLLGLGHSTVPEAIMYPTLDSQTRKVELHDDDIAGMNAMYPPSKLWKLGYSR
ncbi:Matrix metalloproteinase-2 [Nymphaea thermarum]|nr:Matrix metalloproteinase-2 [Nymphaea thermarum]